MTDPKKKRPTPTGAWVTVNNPGPGDVLIQRWDPDAEPPRPAFTLRSAARARIWSLITAARSKEPRS